LPLSESSADVGTITTVAGSGKEALGKMDGAAGEVNIGQTFGVEVAPDGRLWVTEVENHRVLAVDLKSAQVRTMAGNGEKGYSGDGGPARSARLNEPYEVRFDTAGNAYFVEMVGAVIRRIDAKTGTISTIAGTGEPGFGGDGGSALQAQFRSPHSIALDGIEGLYVADIGNHRIPRIDLASGKIETIAGTGEKVLPVEGQVATGRPLLGPRALHITGKTLWVALREGHSVWKMDLEDRRLTHVAGTGKKGYLDGPAKEARFNGPKGIVARTGKDGDATDVFVVDTENQTIRRIDLAAKVVTTVAGVGPAGRGFRGDNGPATQAWLDRPHGIALDADGNLYIGDTNNHRVRRVSSTQD
jgi:sugar lactone lactonase YvrE